jgi:hypothetical protein
MESEAKKCEGGTNGKQCKRPVKPGEKYCYSCNQIMRRKFKESGYTPSGGPPPCAEMLYGNAGGRDYSARENIAETKYGKNQG